MSAPPGPGRPTAATLSRLATFAAAAMTAMPLTQVPAALRRSMQFTPSKRARLIAAPLLDNIDADPEFRQRLGVQLSAQHADLVAELADFDPAVGSTAGTEHDLAALAFVLRPDGWEDVLVAAARADDARRTAPGGELERTAERLTATVEQLREDARAARAKARRQVDGLREENAQLRRTVGQTRADLKQVKADAEAVQAAAAEQRAALEAKIRSVEAEARRLRSRVAELDADNSAARRALRDDRDAEVMRLRLLLETMTDAAAGLKRALRLPPSDLMPADTVVSVEPADADAAWGAGRALLDDDPALLRRLVDLPRVHLIVDGYNVSKEAWPTLPLDQQRNRLVQGVNGLTAGKGAEVTIVFDGADIINPPPVTSPRGIRVRFSPPHVIADDLIRELVEAEPSGRPVVVVSTDAELARSVTKKGARSVASLALIAALGR